MGQFDQSDKYTFIEHTGRHGGVGRTGRGCVRRHVANESLRKRVAQRATLALPVVREPVIVNHVTSGDSDSDRQCSDEESPTRPEDKKPVFDRLGILSLPIGKPYDAELIEHISSRLWPGFRNRFRGSANPFPAYWLPRTVENPALYQALLFSALCHLSSRMSLAGQKPRNKGELIALETKAIMATKEQIDCASAITTPNHLEDLLMITICLATNVQDSDQSMARDPSPFYPILASGRWLDTYGAFACHNVHWNAVLQLVEKRGGLQKINSFGLPWVISW